MPTFLVLQNVSTRSLCFYKGPALLEMEILQTFYLLGCFGLVIALIKQVGKFPSLCSLPTSGGWLNQNIMYSVIPNQLGNCQIPVPSSRFGRDARSSAEGFSHRDPGGGRTVPCTPGERSGAAVPEGVEDAASCITRISIRHGKGLQQLCIKLQGVIYSFKKTGTWSQLKFTQIFQSSTTFLLRSLL